MDKTAVDAIYKAGIKLLLPQSIEEAFKIISSEAIKLVNAEYASIFLENNKKLLQVYATDDFLNEIKIREKGFTYKAFKSNNPSVLGIKEIQKHHLELKAKGIQSTIFIPLTYKNKSIGILSIYSLKKTNFSELEINILKLFGTYSTLAIKKTQFYQETERALEMRDKFISVVAHELRTPLTSIHGYLQLILKRMQDNDEFDKNWIKEMYGETMRLNNLINELIEVNHIESGQQMYHFSQVELDKIISKALSKIAFIYPNRNFLYESKIKKPIYIIGDEQRLQQVLISLLDNAAKFSPSSAPINVTLSAIEKYQIITIKDEGKGISKTELPHIFEGFYKGENNEQVGIGVGLLLAKNIIKKHRGRLSIKSKKSKGTRVEIKLPIVRSEV